MDIKQNDHNGNGWTKRMRISIAVENDPAVWPEPIREIRKKAEYIWSDAARYLTERLVSIRTDMLSTGSRPIPCRSG